MRRLPIVGAREATGQVAQVTAAIARATHPAIGLSSPMLIYQPHYPGEREIPRIPMTKAFDGGGAVVSADRPVVLMKMIRMDH